MKYLLAVVFVVLFAGALGSIDKALLLKEAANLEVTIKLEEKFFSEHRSSFFGLDRQLTALVQLVADIKATNEQSQLLKRSMQLEVINSTVSTAIQTGHSFVDQRDVMEKDSWSTVKAAQKVADELKAKHHEKEAQKLQMSISYLYSILYQIANMRDDQEMSQVRPQYEQLKAKIHTQMQVAHSL